jgi:hypothetical protein
MKKTKILLLVMMIGGANCLAQVVENKNEIKENYDFEKEISKDDTSVLIEKIMKILDDAIEFKNISRENYNKLKKLEARMFFKTNEVLTNLKSQSLLDPVSEEKMKILQKEISNQIKDLECCVKDFK